MSEWISIPKSLAQDILKFLNRRMEQDRWLAEQEKLMTGFQDCMNVDRERADDLCGMCCGTGKLFDGAGVYVKQCHCVKPARLHSASYAKGGQ